MENKLASIINAIQKTRGEDIIIYDFTSLNPFIDRVVITHGDNLRQVFAIANNIQDELKQQGYTMYRMEGDRNSRWILIDADDVIIHIFLEEERELYRLERLYADLPRLEEQYV